MILPNISLLIIIILLILGDRLDQLHLHLDLAIQGAHLSAPRNLWHSVLGHAGLDAHGQPCVGSQAGTWVQGRGVGGVRGVSRI